LGRAIIAIQPSARIGNGSATESAGHDVIARPRLRRRDRKRQHRYHCQQGSFDHRLACTLTLQLSNSRGFGQPAYLASQHFLMRE
jgi:hypothetical protein